MPPLELDLSHLSRLREQVAELSQQRFRLDAEIVGQQSTLDANRRRGVPAQELAWMEARLAEIKREQRHLVERRRALNLELDRLANGLLRERDPAVLAEALDGGQPIALFPVRLETRYVRQGSALRIRIYPDVLNVVQHAEGLTDKERDSGTAYWNARFAGKTDEADRIARDMSLVYGRSRVQWIIRALTPDNLDHQGEDGAAAHFPDVAAIDERAKQSTAVMLPDRWCAIGYAAGRREVFRAWGSRIPDELPMSPDWLTLQDQPERLFDGDRRWLIDFDAAVQQGMALEVTQAQVDEYLQQRQAPPFSLRAATLERLVVLGLEWTRDAAQSAEALAELLSAQRDSRGLGFVPLGTPTNNTEDQPSGFSSEDERTPPPTPSESAQLPKEKDALELIVDTFGLPPLSVSADGVVNAHLPEQRTALHMMNVLWRGTFGHYLAELYNPLYGEEKDLFIKPRTVDALRRYAVSYLRPGGALPVLRVGNQPYGVLPVVGKGFVEDSALESGISKLLMLLRPMWELASQNVPLLVDGDVKRAQGILQTGPWSQRAYYRDQDPLAICYMPSPWGPTKDLLLKNVLGLFGITQYWATEMSCIRFLTDPPFEAGYLAGVPWVLADDKDPKSEAPGAAVFKPEQNYLKDIADALSKPQVEADRLLDNYQSGPALLQALIAYSARLDKHDAALSYASASAVAKVYARSTPVQVNIEPRVETEASFEVRTPKELANVVIPDVTGSATLGQHIAQSLALLPSAEPGGRAMRAADAMYSIVGGYATPLRDMAAVQIGLRYLATRPVGELNVAFRTTLDAFSYRLDAWFTARASRRLQQMRDRKPTGVYTGGFGWVENLKPDARPDSEGYMLAPSLGQAATAAILRSGFMANHEQGAFNIDLDSNRTRRALGVLQGLTRDQPLTALYGYRIERALRDALLGKLIWPLRLAFPYRPAGNSPDDEPKEAIGARDVVDAVALMDAWQTDAGKARVFLASVEIENAAAAAGKIKPFDLLKPEEWTSFTQIVNDAIALADAVSDLLLAEGMYQIVQGNFERAGAAMAAVDKQALPIDAQVARTPRGGVAYTQRVAALCPALAAQDWPQDERSRAEPRLNAWLAQMLGAPARYRFGATVHRQQASAKLDADWNELGYSPLSAVLAATSIIAPSHDGQAETGFRGRLVAALLKKIADPQNVTGLDIEQDDAAPDRLGLGRFEALAATLRQLLDKMRPITRKDLVIPDDDIEKTLPDEGEYPGVGLTELQARANAVITSFSNAHTTVKNSANADDLLTKLRAMEAFLPALAWPPEVLAIDAPGSDPAKREDRGQMAKAALDTMLQAKLDKVNAPIELRAGQAAPTHGQSVQHAIDQIKELLGKDFPVLPVFALNAYVAEFNASLAQQDALTLKKRGLIGGWMTQLARVREGVDRFAGALSAHQALIDFASEGDFKLVQYPHRDQQVWAALPEAWSAPEGAAFDPDKVQEELRDYLTKHPDAPFKDAKRDKPGLALVLHIPGAEGDVAADTMLAGFVCDEWQELIPDPYQTAGIGFHYDAPGARPPQTILLALPPRANQERWRFDDVLDTVHEAWDLARLRGVRPIDLESGLGALLPANYLPQSYTDDLPSVRLLELQRRRLKEAIRADNLGTVTIALGKI